MQVGFPEQSTNESIRTTYGNLCKFRNDQLPRKTANEIEDADSIVTNYDIHMKLGAIMMASRYLVGTGIEQMMIAIYPSRPVYAGIYVVFIVVNRKCESVDYNGN